MKNSLTQFSYKGCHSDFKIHAALLQHSDSFRVDYLQGMGVMFAILRSILRPAKRLNIPFIQNFSSKWQYSSRAGLTQYTKKTWQCHHSQVIITRTQKLSSKKMFEDNLSKQIDEIEALSAIYPDEWKTEDPSHRTYSISITEGGRTVTLLITLPPEYPSQSPPLYLLTAPWMSSHDRDELCSDLEQLYTDYIGESILHMWIEKVREYLQQRQATEEEVSRTVTAAEENERQIKLPDVEVEADEECPTIISGEPFTDRKSKFQGHVAIVTSVAQVKLVLAELYKNRKIAQATHNIYAYRIYNESTKMWLQDCEDDGETHAGGRVMHLLQILDVKNVLVVVTRWFGGILLGGDRFKHINNAARDVLELGHFLDASGKSNSPASGGGDAAKKKNRKGK